MISKLSLAASLLCIFAGGFGARVHLTQLLEPKLLSTWADVVLCLGITVGFSLLLVVDKVVTTDFQRENNSDAL